MQNPKLQDVVALGKMQQLYDKYKNFKDVASVWFSGKPAQGNNSYDSTSRLGTQQYVQQVLARVPNFSNDMATDTAMAGMRD